ncbi:hypothetical protein PVAND_017572 [Polypedilum vanderplanki]|uniref:Uncharacterized protein n=1 Tax=Polypedilum vanderplanki TaxID=319348 RepID=A0A9J6BIG3_POLVA|nr:hypothetical protein PVAND_017572 [Polypedilum vanderplanki]
MKLIFLFFAFKISTASACSASLEIINKCNITPGMRFDIYLCKCICDSQPQGVICEERRKYDPISQCCICEQKCCPYKKHVVNRYSCFCECPYILPCNAGCNWNYFECICECEA